MAPTVMDRPIATSLHMPRASNAKFCGGTFASSMSSNISFVPSTETACLLSTHKLLCGGAIPCYQELTVLTPEVMLKFADV